VFRKGKISFDVFSFLCLECHLQKALKDCFTSSRVVNVFDDAATPPPSSLISSASSASKRASKSLELGGEEDGPEEDPSSSLTTESIDYFGRAYGA
jgi:hypothetical protein